MRIGVVCEGPTDFFAIRCFFGHALAASKVASEFVPLQPPIDNTSPEGGWGNVLLWLKNNPPATRVQRYFGGGLFADELAEPSLDCILIHLDSDVLGESSFSEFLRSRYSFTYVSPGAATQKASKIREIIHLVAQLSQLTNEDVKRHVEAPAVESTETWCVAAFDNRNNNYELLSGEALTTSFMTALEASEGRSPKDSYSTIDKTVSRRRKFCETHSVGSQRVLRGCEAFRDTLARITALK